MESNAQFNPDVSRPLALLQACPAYEQTPLVRKTSATGADVLLKDESGRMGLGSFKALGGVYAVARLVEAAWIEAGNAALEPEQFTSTEVRRISSDMCFVCASAGNHGMSVAAGARIFGARARIYLAETVPENFAGQLKGMSAEVVRAGETYEDAVEAAKRDAADIGSLLLADGSWEGYTQRPALVMEGYTVLAEEMRLQLKSTNLWPETVFLQAGVGGFAAAIAVIIRQSWERQPRIVVVEPDQAACLSESARQGRPITVSGGVSIMGRLDCKEPSILAVEALSRLDVSYASVTDAESRRAVEDLAALGLNTSPSGAAGFAALSKSKPGGRSLVVLTEGPV